MRLALSYLYYRLNAKNLHGVHSPFFYALNKEVLRKKSFPQAGDIEDLRSDLSKNHKKVELKDLGAGSRVNKSNYRSISEIARVSAGNKKDLALLHNLASWVEAENILELGSNLGLGTLALSTAKTAKKVVTIEGDPTLAAMAVKNLEKLGSNAEVIAGSFEDNLDLAFEKLKTVDLAYLDGNHKKTPTLNYFNRIKEYSHNDTVIVIGDIHWSEEMEDAWDEIKSDQAVAATADIFSMGLVFFKKELSKEHFTLHG